MDAGVAKLMELLKSDNESIALKAANDLITHGFKAAELANMRREEDATDDSSEIFSYKTILAAWRDDEQREAQERKAAHERQRANASHT